MKLKKALMLVALLTPALFVQAHEYKVGELQIEHPWSREVPPVSPTAAVYFGVHNHGATADRLLSAATPAAGRAELHEHVQADGLMKMRHVQAVEIPAKGEVSFAPMGYHVMLFELKQPLKDGQRFPLTLHFEQAGDVQVEVAVQKDAPAAHAEEHEHKSAP